ncbi:HNH endonuclease [Bauldia litoralis]|uniref:HNH endonuclease n=1 Tax=Bauldia litoralis TaxID=665467 RepID=UPI0032645B82
MSRSVSEWIGATDDTAIPPRVRLRVFDAKGGKCHSCGRKIAAGERWTCEHLIALINGGENRESNLDITCDWCLPSKNAADVAEKSKVASLRKSHLGIKERKPGFRGWRKFDGTPVFKS